MTTPSVKQLRILLRDYDARIWTDDELETMLGHGLVWWNLTTPMTNLTLRSHGPQSTAILWASAVLAITHLLWHRSHEEELLSPDERDRYEELLDNAERIFEESKLTKPSLFPQPQETIWN